MADEESVRDPDLQVRAGCKYCHALLEPAASYWGRWTEQGIAYLEPTEFPAERSDCLTCALTNQGCTNQCRTHYLTTALSEQEIPYLGKLKAYTFRRTEHENNVEIAPDPRMDAVFEMIFRQLDWDDYLTAYEITSAELMAKLPEKYRKFYEPHHKQFLANGEFC